MRQQLDHQRNRLRRSSKTSGGRRVNIIRPRKIRVVLEGLRGEDSTARIAIIAITLEVHDETLSYGWCHYQDVFVTVPHEKIRTIKPDNEEDQGLPEVVAAHTQVRMPSLEQYDYDLTS